jgi:hypothetical protein
MEWWSLNDLVYTHIGFRYGAGKDDRTFFIPLSPWRESDVNPDETSLHLYIEMHENHTLTVVRRFP